MHAHCRTFRKSGKIKGKYKLHLIKPKLHYFLLLFLLLLLLSIFPSWS